MTDIEFITNETEYLFGCNFFSDDFDPDGNTEHQDRADELLTNYPWRKVFETWKKYLFDNCKDVASVMNFCNLYSYYGGTDQAILDPYDFLGYIFSVVDIKEYWDQYGDFLDSFCISILEECGRISTMKKPGYQSWKDPLLIEAVNKYRTT